ncbi:hypothetical protein LX32DRAFT_333647 [Colletotrichum zoysiae]|uniref:Uncharacterized protein n=1 Tax=Colletotrichum zoysiae TaxID=1216348 RepID=A0AAD9HLY3_9PEZI|nr:hypothetical protein LX32DRAFT_333647 [Colletotrichum zoysiae]
MATRHIDLTSCPAACCLSLPVCCLLPVAVVPSIYSCIYLSVLAYLVVFVGRVKPSSHLLPQLLLPPVAAHWQFNLTPVKRAPPRFEACLPPVAPLASVHHRPFQTRCLQAPSLPLNGRALRILARSRFPLLGRRQTPRAAARKREREERERRPISLQPLLLLFATKLPSPRPYPPT